MAYVFTNEGVGKAKITDETETELTLAGINTSGNDANQFMNGITTMLDLVGWTIQDAIRIVNQDVEEQS